MAGPLQGIRVLELGRFIACPFCGMLLGDMGAEVIKIERSTGADDRYLGLLAPCGNSYTFINVNRSKKAISLNFEKNEKAREILKDLVKLSDVVITNFSIDAAKMSGITYENLKSIKPDIIFAHVTAFGQEGPYSNRIGFDMTVKAMSGSMNISGFPGDPIREQVYYLDYSTGCLTTIGVLSALLHREKTGEGQMIDTSLMQTSMNYNASFISEYETGGILREQMGNRGYWVGPNDLYKTKDGRHVLLAVITDAIWKRFCRFIGREDLIEDPRFHNDLARFEHREILDTIVSEWVGSLTEAELLAAAEKIPLPVGTCYKQNEVASDPQVKACNMLVELPFPNGSTAIAGGIPLNMSETKLEIERSVPSVGQDNEEIYCGLLGFGRDELARLKDERTI